MRAYFPVKSGLRFSMNALRPSLRSALAKQASTFLCASPRSRSAGSFSHCWGANLAAATVSGSVSETAAHYSATPASSCAAGSKRLAKPMRSASAASNLRAETKMSSVFAAPITFMKRRTPLGL